MRLQPFSRLQAGSGLAGAGPRRGEHRQQPDGQHGAAGEHGIGLARAQPPPGEGRPGGAPGAGQARGRRLCEPAAQAAGAVAHLLHAAEESAVHGG
jgi:hypothetical protein